MGLRASNVLERAEPGRVLTAFCESVGAARLELRAAAEELEHVPTLVALEWERAPALAAELDEIRGALAYAAASLWPDWYITAEQRFERMRSADAGLSEVLSEVAGAAPKPSTSWLREAWRKCEQGKLPLVGRLTSAEQVRQLSRALDPRRLVFALSVVSADATAARVRGLSRAAEWLAHESQAKTILLAPGEWQGNHELDHVTYEAMVLAGPEADARPPAEAKPRTRDAVQVLVGPILGRPHPASEVEKLLHARLTADDELSGLFQFNQGIVTEGDRRYIADVVWRQGGLVIEIDGSEHCRPQRYYDDRERDYRLYMCGYTTLRVTNDEVRVDVERVLAKVRNVVRRLKASGTGQMTNGIST